MWTRRHFGGVAGGALAAGATTAKAQGHISQGADARALRAFAETTHPRGREAAADPAWNVAWDSLESEAAHLEPAAYIMALQERLAWFADGHTTIPFAAVETPGFDLDLPIEGAPMDDGLFVSAAEDEGLPLLGARISRIEGVDVADLARRFVRVWPGDNTASNHPHLDLMLKPALMRGLGLTPAKSLAAPVEVEATAGAVAVRATLIPRATSPRSRRAFPRSPSPVEAMRPEGAPNFIRTLQDGRAVLIAFDSLGEDLQATLRFVRACFAALEEIPARRVILDLRRNGGGNNFLGEGLRKYLERSRFNRPGALYVLTSPRTFSAAQNLANRLERETYALFVGRPTGGAPNHYGDARPFDGLGYRAFVSTLPWFDSYPQDRRRWIMPDILVPDVFADWAAGRDPALEAALTHTTDQPPDDLSRARTFPYERASQSATWTPFWA